MGDGPRITPHVYNPDTRLKHHFRAATLAIPFVAALAVAFATDTTLGFPLPAGAGPDGAAPPWGASMGVGPYAEVNLRTGHVLTRLPVVGWSGRGPAVAFALYHNAVDGNGLTLRPKAGTGTGEPGPNVVWRTSYSNHLVFDAGDVIVVRDDGTQDRFTAAGGAYTAPPGVFETLTGDAAAGYTLTDKRQNKTHYNGTAVVGGVAAGALLTIEDASGNVLTMNYDTGGTGALTSVTDAAGRALVFTCDAQGALATVADPLDHTWTLQHSAAGRFTALQDPMGFTIAIGYDWDGRITSLSDKDGHAVTYTYSGGKLVRVDDPAPLTTHQTFSYQALANGGSRTTHTDRRGHTWWYEFDALDNLVKITNPLLHEQTLVYDVNGAPGVVHNVTQFTDGLLHTWAYAYDAMGNRLTATDPLGHLTTWTYDALNNNLLTVTPPLDNQGNGNPDKRVTLHYDDGNNPTRVTSIDEPSAATTTLEYYGPQDHPEWTGLLKRVTDPNLVVTLFKYDQWGQPAEETENPIPNPPLTSPPTVTSTTAYDAAGRLTDAWHDITSRFECLPAPRPHATLISDGNGNVTEIICGLNMACSAPLTGDCQSPDPGGAFSAGCATMAYTKMGLPTSIDRCIEDPSTLESGNRTTALSYDAFGRVTSQTVTSAEATWADCPEGCGPVSRTFGHDYDDAVGSVLTTGPDGLAIFTVLDSAGRVGTVTRTTPNGVLQATYTYDAAGRNTLIDYANGTQTVLTYDDAGRMTGILHQTDALVRIREMVYNYAPDGLVNWIDDTDAAGAMSRTTFQYDNRNRLIGEVRTITGGLVSVYDLSYTYDPGGNRLSKTDNLTGRATTYHYDVNDSSDGGQHNNRLLSYTISDGGQPVEEASYDYGADGNVARLIRWFPTHPTQSRVYWFYYDTSDHLWMAVSATGEYDAANGTLTNCNNDKAAEYRYDSGRARYLVRPRNPATLDVLAGAQWRDYDGDAIYDDYTVDSLTGNVTDGTAYLAGVGFDDPAGANMPSYTHTDLIGSARVVSNQLSVISGELAYTAFGEPISDPPTAQPATRYLYAGAWGYETADSFDPLAELGWLHVGARYYDPALGRFVQRDPIGIAGGLNTYVYVTANPLIQSDPTGQRTSEGKIAAHFGGAIAGAWAADVLCSAIITVLGIATDGVVPGLIVVGGGAVGYDEGGNLYDDFSGEIERSIDGWRLLFEWITNSGRFKPPPPLYGGVPSFSAR